MSEFLLLSYGFGFAVSGSLMLIAHYAARRIAWLWVDRWGDIVRYAIGIVCIGVGMAAIQFKAGPGSILPPFIVCASAGVLVILAYAIEAAQDKTLDEQARKNELNEAIENGPQTLEIPGRSRR